MSFMSAWENINIMKVLIIIISACYFLTASSNAQTLQWDSTYRPSSYAMRVSLFNNYEHSCGNIYFLGNSITFGADWNELLVLPKARNRGISGDITFGVLERLEEIIKAQPFKIFILIGINDIARNIPDSVVIHNCALMIKRIRSGAPNTHIFIQTLLPVNNTFEQHKNHHNKANHIAAVNEGLKKLATQTGVNLVDLHPHFLDSDGRLSKEYTSDGLHLNAMGYNLWAKLLRPYLK